MVITGILIYKSFIQVNGEGWGCLSKNIVNLYIITGSLSRVQNYIGWMLNYF